MKSSLPHLKAIVQYTKKLPDKEEGVSILEVKELGEREGEGERTRDTRGERKEGKKE